jgi:hypothetical protein
MPPSVDQLLLKVNFPLLGENTPSGWTVNIVDTPGFRDIKENIQEVAKESVDVSAAYIYLLQTENVGGSEVSELLEPLATKDQGRLNY